MSNASLVKRRLLRVFVALCLLGQVGLVGAGVYEDLLKAVEANDTASVTSILGQGMDVNTVDPAGNTLLMLAARNGNPELVRFLLNHRAKLDVRNRHGDSALMLAALKGQQEIVRDLVTAGAKIDGPGWTPLIYASYEGRVETVRYLLDNGADPNAVAPNGTTALMLAARNGHIEIVRILLKARADPEIENDQGATALEWAMAAGHTEIIKLLESSRLH